MIYDLQKADIWKRASAALLDIILTAILAIGFIYIMAFAFDFDGYAESYDAIQHSYEEKHGVSFTEMQDLEKYNAMTPEEKQHFDAAFKEFATDEEAIYLYNMLFSLTILTISVGTLLAFAVLEFAIPLILKNGQTVGKKVFGIAVMRLDHVRISAPFLFARNILGKYTVETMIPIVLIVLLLFNIVGVTAIAIIALVVLSNIVLMIASKTNSGIHDMLASTVVVDMASQMIFDSPEAVLEYKQKVHAEAVEKAGY